MSQSASAVQTPRLRVLPLPACPWLCQCYTFIVGKISVEKLANFGEIDVFVMVACREASLVDSTVRSPGHVCGDCFSLPHLCATLSHSVALCIRCCRMPLVAVPMCGFCCARPACVVWTVFCVIMAGQEYHKPLVTPFEMMIALDAGFSWSGRYGPLPKIGSDGAVQAGPARPSLSCNRISLSFARALSLSPPPTPRTHNYFYGLDACCLAHAGPYSTFPQY